MFKDLRDRTVKVYIIRVIVVGQDGVGKTTSSKQLLGHDVNISERKSTEGIDAHVHHCRVSLATGEWVKQDKVSSLPPNLCDNKLSERQLGRLSMKIGCKSVHLGLELGLSWADIEQIQKDYPNTVTKCLMILFKRKLQSRDKATFRNLEKALRSADIDVVILKSVNTAGDRVSCLPPDMLDKESEGGHLKQICSRIWTGHVHLSIELEVPLSRIEQILIEHTYDVQRQCFEIMYEWRQRQARQATFRNLEQAFKCIGINPNILKQSVT